MAYEKQVWQSNELITSEKLNHIEDGIANAKTAEDIVNNLTETTTGKVLDATQGKVLKDAIDNLDAEINSLDAEDVGAIKDDYDYNYVGYPYTGNELILLHNTTTGENTVTDVASFLSSAGGSGSGSNQGALVHYTKRISLNATAGTQAQSFSDSNITENMVVLQAEIDNPSAQVNDWIFNTTNGMVTLNGTVNAATNVTLYFGVSLTAAPSIQVNLGSTIADNVLKANPQPGVMGVLGTAHGGTGVNAIDAADLRSKLGITPANIGAVSASAIIDISHGGTGATDAFSALKNLFDVGFNTATNYPDKPGVYLIAGQPIFSNMTPDNTYGILVIFKAFYSMHIFLDGASNLYYGFSGDIFGEPATWYRVNKAAM